MPSTSLYSLSLSIFTSAHFISSTILITLSSLTFDCFTFSSKSTPFTITSTFSVFLTSNYSGFTNVLSLLSFFTPISQSSLLLKLSAFPILLSGTYFSIELNLDKYKAHLACFLLNFCTFIKYLRFL